MKGTSGLAALLACVAASCGGGGGGGEADASDGQGAAVWEQAFDRIDGSFLSSVWGSSPDDVFIVGGNREQGEVHHFDGQSWTVEVLEDAQVLVWVHGLSSSSIYAVGLAGSAVHYDGESWQSMNYPGDEDLWGIWGPSDDDLWIVGGAISDGTPVLTHYDGETFTPYALDAEQNPLGAHSLFKVWGSGDRIIAVGQSGLVLSHEGDQWTRVSAGENADDDFISLSGTSADDIVLVGGRSSARVATADGSRFETVKPSGAPGLSGVFVDQTAVYVGGLRGVVGRFDRASGEVREEQSLTDDVHAMWGDGAGTIYAVGGAFAEPFSGIAYVRRDQQ